MAAIGLRRESRLGTLTPAMQIATVRGLLADI
jgi:hypothetical protein